MIYENTSQGKEANMAVRLQAKLNRIDGLG
jgi:hypothetical protein